MNIPFEDIPGWKRRFRQDPASIVLREIAQRYALKRSALGMVLPDLADEVSTPAVQAVWTWDFDKRGTGLSDEQLDRELASLRF